MRFKGNYLILDILHEIELLQSNETIEVQRSDLDSEFHWRHGKENRRKHKTSGKVLFVDEAHT